MTSRPLIVDGLWKCLCPRFSAAPRSVALRPLRQARSRSTATQTAVEKTPAPDDFPSLSKVDKGSHKPINESNTNDTWHSIVRASEALSSSRQNVRLEAVDNTPVPSTNPALIEFPGYASEGSMTGIQHGSSPPQDLNLLEQEYTKQESQDQELKPAIVTYQSVTDFEGPDENQTQVRLDSQHRTEHANSPGEVHMNSNSRSPDQKHPTITALRPESLVKDSPLGRLLSNCLLDEVPTPDLYVTLRSCAARGLMKEVDYLARVLVVERHEKPNLKLYGSLISSNVDPAVGSAEEVMVLLAELTHKGLVADTGIYHNALRVLAVHPHPVLRSRILQEMQSSWISISESGWHDIVASCVKEGHIEQALECLDDMRDSQIRVLPWLYQLIIYRLCDLDEVVEATTMLKHMITIGVTDISPSLWYYVFDTACNNLQYDALQFIWNRRVELNRLNPSVQQCTRVLTAAARNGDAQLANDVFRVLGKRSAVFESQHYEALMEAYVGIDDIKTALTVLCIMSRSGVVPDQRSTRPIHSYASQSADRARKMLATLRDLQKDGRDIPVAAVNCLLESSTGNLTLEEIVEQYKSLHELCPQGPDVHTFNSLFRACRLAKRKDTAMFFASEMVHIGVKPDPLTYDRLILVCVEGGSYEDAFRYLQEMRANEMIPRAGTMRFLIEKYCEAKDERAWTILHMMQELRMDTAAARSKAWLDDNWDPNTKLPNVDGAKGEMIPQVAAIGA